MSKTTSDSSDQYDRLDQPEHLSFPDNWTLTESWKRAQTERDRGRKIDESERMVWLTESDEPKRVCFVLQEDELRAKCSCAAWQYRGWCAHVAHCWWRWVRGDLTVHHLDTGRKYEHPPSWLDFDRSRDLDLSDLPPGQLDAYLACELGEAGVRDYADYTDRSPGTVGNHLALAREKMEE